jgi:hypothetical protein
MPIRGSPNGANHLRPQAGRDRLEQVVAINRNAWSQSIGTAGRNHPVRALLLRDELGATYSQPETGEAREPKALSRNFPVGGGWKLQRSAPHGRLHKVPPC